MKKKSSLLLVCFFMAIAVGAQQWHKPQLPFTDFLTGVEIYLYNVGAGRFYTEGNSYGTQGSLSKNGLKCKFVANASDGGATVKLTNFSNVKDAWKTAYVSTNGTIWVDADSSTESNWKVVKGDAKMFKLMISSPNIRFNQENYPGAMLGLDLFEDTTRTALSCFLMEAEEPGEGIYLTDWAVVLPDDYNTFMEQTEVYENALILGGLLDEAFEKGKDVTTEFAVYENTSSTLAEIQSAIDSVTDKLIEDLISGATKDNPIDLTRLYITNPSYENNDNEGWNGNTPGFNALNDYQNAELFNTNYTCYQQLTNLPDGYYEVRLQGFYRAGLPAEALTHKQGGENAYMHSELYATTGGVVTSTKLQSIFTGAPTQALGIEAEINLGNWWVPDGMVAAKAYFDAGYYRDNSVVVHVTNGKLIIGLTKSTTIYRDWTMFDNWQLLYYGKENPEL
ncbi:MAG: hypothetical protein IKA86_06100 [Paraprevotella sp.]|nr:hypothetical protein [Paraprevotella sp.]